MEFYYLIRFLTYSLFSKQLSVISMYFYTVLLHYDY